MDTTAPTFWGDNRVHRLRELIESAFSAAAAARKLEEETGHPITRDAVTSKARALGLSFTGRAGRPRADGEAVGTGPKRNRGETPAPSDAHQRVRWSILRPRPMPLPLHELRVVRCAGEPKPLLERGEACCAWPVSDWLEEGCAAMPYCCAPVEPGRSYCPDHVAIAYQPATVAA